MTPAVNNMRIHIWLILALPALGGFISATGSDPTATPTKTHVSIGQDASLTCNTKSEDMRWSLNGKNITKGSNKR